MFLIAGPVLAEKPPWAGGGNNKPGGPPEKYETKAPPPEPGHDAGSQDYHGKGKGKDPHGQPGKGPHKHFTDNQRIVIHDYYANQYRKGKPCPPGLAKKHNGCMPPGQAKKWAVGKPLPREVVCYPLPSNLVVQLGPPPPNTKYVRVAQDVLLLATGTNMVVDAIQNLNWEFKH